MDRQKESTNGRIAGKFIETCIAIIIVFIESILTIVEFFKKGILRKEILSERSNIGFNIDIIFRD